jgi:pyruvate/2-oxoglutarate dehydrogenase complex dihydrolipoamide acyltransferase (E2) component
MSCAVPEPVPVVLPKWGMTMVEATIVEWLKAIGDAVEAGESLVTVETDKVEATVESPVAGTLVEVLVAPDDDVPVGATLAYVRPGPPSGT